MPRVILIIMLVAAACMSHESKPKVGFTYPGAISPTQFDQDVTFAVGTPVAIDAEISSLCERDATKWGDKNDSAEYYECHKSNVDVAVKCSGPCQIDAANRVVPTAPGTLEISVDVTSKKTKNQYPYRRTITVVPANGFTLASDGPHQCYPPAVDRGASTFECHVRAQAPLIELQIEEPFGARPTAPLLLDGQPWQSNRFSLAGYIQARGGVDERGGTKLPAEPLRVELTRGEFKKTLVFVFAR